MNPSINLITPVIGATIDVDLASVFGTGEEEQKETADQIYAALINHLVVFLEDQHITPAQQIACVLVRSIARILSIKR